MPHLSRLAAALSLALLATTSVYAQRAQVAPSAAPKASPSAIVNQSSPNPAGLRPLLPSGLTAGSGAAVATDPNIAAAAPISDVGSSMPGSDAVNAAAATTVMGAGGSRGPAQYLGSGNPGFSAIDIARSFITADGNRDNELTEAEARRLSISMMSFQEMDRNFDGRVSRSEYEDSLR
ncbi:EF-hand domain-containing protein [Ramlibacter sp. XY19]|uniref:EF-hand domain-containing protein n=1 Tax=Ramlibacter paludis TaxID=2908000 RepID=UPI0023DC12B7|nr:EF-hand domain-containing protein [Ramlibacter paludis]MCG2594536.1 EF-hand domain-containing protein [Ramlibacter paludis]